LPGRSCPPWSGRLAYKKNLEAIPYDELPEEGKKALDEINAAIELIYTSLDPAKWNEIQWDKIVNSEQFTDDIRALNDLAAEGELTVDKFKEQFPELAQACEDAGLDIGDVINNLAKDTETVDDVVGKAARNALKGYEAIKSSVGSVSTVMAEFNSVIMDGDSLTESAYNSLAELAGGEEALAGCVDKTNGYLVTNADELNNLVDSAVEASKAQLKLAESHEIMKHHEMVNVLKELCSGEEEYSDETLAAIDTALKQIDATELQIAQYKLLEQQLLGVTNAFDRMESAKAVDEARDYTDELSEGIGGLIESFEKHEFGTQFFKTAFEALIPEDIYGQFAEAGEQLDAGWDYLNTKLARYFSFDNGNVSIDFSNIQSFVSDALESGVFVGDLEHFDLSSQITTLQEFAEQMGLTETAAFSLANAVSKYTTDGDDFLSKLSMDGASLETQILACDTEMAKLLETQARLGKEGKIGSPEWDALQKEIGAANQKMDELQKKARSNITAHIELESNIVEQQGVVDELEKKLEGLDENSVEYQSNFRKLPDRKGQIR